MSHHSYSYLERRYSRKTRLEVLLLAMGLAVALVGGVVALQMSVTEAARNAKANGEHGAEESLDRESVSRRQNDSLRNACYEGTEACAEEQEEIRKQNCQLYREGCRNQGPKWQPDPLFGDVDKQLQERLRNLQ